MKLKLLTLITSILMIGVNLLATALPINNQTTAQISDSFKVFFVPAGYVFSIWGIIYLGIIAFNIYLFLPLVKDNLKVRRILPAVIISNLFNALWIVLWHYNLVTLSVGAMLIILLSLIYIFNNFSTRLDLSKKEAYLVKLPFSIYLGWISVATIANVTIFLYTLNWNGFGISGPVWASILVVVAAILAGIMLIKHRDVAYSLVIVWAVLGIASKFSTENTLSTVSYLSSLVICLLVVYTVIRKLNRTNV